MEKIELAVKISTVIFNVFAPAGIFYYAVQIRKGLESIGNAIKDDDDNDSNWWKGEKEC